MAAFNFPNSPAVDQVFTPPSGGPVYVWDGQKWKYVPVSGDGGGGQPLDATLTALAGLTTAADRVAYFTGVDVAAVTPLTSFGRSLIDDADAATARTTIGAAPLASPAFTGTPTAPTATAGTSTTQLASTAFVAAAVTAGSGQPADATLTALAALDATAGLLEETAADTFAKRALGVGATTSIPTRADGDGRWVTIAGDSSSQTVIPSGGTTARTLAIWLGSIPATVATGTYTLLESDHGKLITFSAACTVTVPSGLPANFVVALCQGHASGQVTLTASGTTISEPDGFLKTAKQFAVMSLIAQASNTYLLTGRTGA